MPALTDLSTIRSLCDRYGFSLSKGFGQNFIINPGVCPRIAESAGIGPDWGVLEIGPGIGVLTEQLAKRAARVVSVEIDRRLFPLLAETLAGYDNIRIVEGDVLKVDLKGLIAREFAGRPVAVCANLPYYITSPILMRLLEERLPVENITVMVQREAAQRLCAPPGTRQAGAISYAVAYYARPRQLFTVQPGSFYPAPKVTSAVIRLDVRKTPRGQPGPGGGEGPVCPDPGGLLPAAQDRGQRHLRRPVGGQGRGAGGHGGRRAGHSPAPRTDDAGALHRPAGRAGGPGSAVTRRSPL